MYARTGVQLKDTKKPLVIARLRSRLEELGMKRFSDYLPLIEKSGSPEMEVFINALTTNETYFFRHTKQFNMLFETIFPEISEQKRKTNQKEIKIWTAACSTGEEPYSLAIASKEFFKDKPFFKVRILASDINTRVINTAKLGRYNERSLKELSENLRNKYFTSVDSSERRIKLNPEFALKDDVKKSVEFFQHNLLERSSHKDVDIIFLRNVMIYFNNESKQKVVSNIEQNLVSGGYFFISLSETLNDVKSQLKSVSSGIYKKV